MTADVYVETLWAATAHITQPCPGCDGEGRVEVGPEQERDCPHCNCTGRVPVFPTTHTLPQPCPPMDIPECTGAADCPSPRHILGCYAGSQADDRPVTVGFMVAWNPTEAQAIEAATGWHAWSPTGGWVSVGKLTPDGLNYVGTKDYRVGEVTFHATLTDCRHELDYGSFTEPIDPPRSEYVWSFTDLTAVDPYPAPDNGMLRWTP